MTITVPTRPAVAEPALVELRFAVDAAEAPLVYPEASWPDPGHVEQLAVEVAGRGLLATLVLPVGEARSWAGELFSAVAVAYREATGDPHALTDFELASLPPADGYDHRQRPVSHSGTTSARSNTETRATPVPIRDGAHIDDREGHNGGDEYR
jgi:hypothetical protein